MEDAREWDSPWRKWGPYLSERQWGTVREDYSQDGDAWKYFPHDHARSRAYHWGEDGLAGFCDLKQRLCFALALWNGNDPILKERLFGLTNGEGNHGEDVKEYYFYLDSTPTHSYMKWLYKYPHAAFPYDDLVETNARRSRQDYEYELIDTGVFDDDRYFDVVVEYAKSSPEECFVQITVTNRGPETAPIHLLPTLWFRNTWSWWPGTEKPHLAAAKGTGGTSVVAASHPELGDRWLYCDGAPPLLFTENETNTERLFDTPNASPYVKDAFHACVVHGNADAVNPARDRHQGRRPLPPRRRRRPVGDAFGSASPMRRRPRARLRRSTRRSRPGAARRTSSIETCTPESASDGHRARSCGRPSAACSGPSSTTSSTSTCGSASTASIRSTRRRRYPVRNRHWFHMFNDDVISMPDKWEYPWYAAWDLAFHAVGAGAASIRISPSISSP